MRLTPLHAWCCLILILTPSAASGQGEQSRRVFFDETFVAKQGSWTSHNAQAADGQLLLSCASDGLWEGVRVVFAPAVAVPAAGEATLHLQLTLAGATSPKGGYSARIFLTPGVIADKQFVDPYGTPHVLALYVDGDEKGATASLYAKSGETGIGRRLYSGSVSAKSFPLPIDVRLDRATYRLQFGSELETRSGSRSGYHRLAADQWQGDATFGLRLVNTTKGNKPQLRLAKAKAALEPLAQAAALLTEKPVQAPRPAPLPAAPSLAIAESDAGTRRHVFFDENFQAKGGAWMSQNAQTTDGQLVLSCASDGLWHGVQAIFAPAVAVPDAGEGTLRLQFTLAGVATPKGGYSARFFLTPGVHDGWKWIEPYGLAHVLALYVDGDEKGGTVSLCGKSGETGAGKVLYSGAFAAKSFPLPVDLRLDQAAYRIEFGSEVETKRGSRLGYHHLAEGQWQADATFGVRLVNSTKGNKPQMRLSHAKAAVELPAHLPAKALPGMREPIPAAIRVHPTVVQSVGGYDQVQALFGGNVNGSTGDKATALLSDLNLNTSRIHMFEDVYGAPPEKQAPVTPSWSAQFGIWMGRKPLAPEEVGPAWDKWFAQDFSLFLEPAMQRGLSSPAGQDSQLRWAKAWGNTAGAVYLPTHRIDGNALRNLDGACRYYDQFLNAVAKHAPWMESRFIQLTNEPDYGWWTGSFKDLPAAVAGWTELYNAVDTHLQKTHPGTRLLGPCLGSDAFFSWGAWQTWTVPVLRGAARDLEYFNYHNYSMAAWSHLAWVEMLQAQAEALGRRRPRAVITEMNDGADCSAAGHKFEWWSEQFFMAFENPDKIHLWSYFLVAERFGRGGGEWGNLVSFKGDAYVPTDTYRLFWVLRQTRGSTRYVEPSGVANLKVLACAPRDDRLVVSLLNDTGRPVRLMLRSGLPRDAKIQQLVRCWACRQAGIVWHGEDKLDPAPEVEAVLTPGAVESFVWTLSEPALKAGARVESREFFSKEVGRKFSQTVEAPIDVPRLPQQDEAVSLRFAVSSDDLLTARGLTLAVNGHEQPVSWSDAPREQQRGDRCTWWMELPVPRDRIEKTNRIAFCKTDADYRLMFVSLVYRQQRRSLP